jgi:hypothetical protein
VSISAREVLGNVHGVSHYSAICREGATAAITLVYLDMIREIVL